MLLPQRQHQGADRAGTGDHPHHSRVCPDQPEGVYPEGAQHLVAKAKKRIAELDMLIKKLYETYAMGKLEEKRFELLSAGYEKEQDELEQALAADQARLDQFNEDTDRADKFLALAKKYTDFSELTAPMLHEFVEKIMVHAPDRSTGERVQEIEIYCWISGDRSSSESTSSTLSFSFSKICPQENAVFFCSK